MQSDLEKTKAYCGATCQTLQMEPLALFGAGPIEWRPRLAISDVNSGG